jgi:hypothetical protein
LLNYPDYGLPECNELENESRDLRNPSTRMRRDVHSIGSNIHLTGPYPAFLSVWI